MAVDLELRDVVEDDIPTLFEHHRDPTAAQMAAFGTRDPDAAEFAARWKKGLTDATSVRKAIVVDGHLVGFVATYVRDDKPQVTYWIARSHWGRGIASTALSRLLQLVTVRPIFASAARDNQGSLRVLQKCGFVIRGAEKAFATARDAEVEEVFLELTSPDGNPPARR